MIGQQHRQKNNYGKPPTMLNRMVNDAECRFNYLKTVHSLQELYDFGFENQCNCARAKYPTFKNVLMRCLKAKPARGGCPFALLAWRPEPDKKHIHVYAQNNKHNHHIAATDERAMQKQTIWSDQKTPIANFRTPNGREWILKETTTITTMNTRKMLFNFVNKLEQQYHCSHPNIKAMRKLHLLCRFTLFCTNTGNRRINCNFAVLAQRTDRDRFHVYTSGQHMCWHANKAEENAIPLNQNAVLSDANPPTNLSTKGGWHWTYLETTGENLVDALDMIRRKYSCSCTEMKRLKKQRYFCIRLKLYCTMRWARKCPFKLLAQKTDRDRFHLYRTSDQHTCIHKKENVLTKYAVLPEKHPPTNISTLGGRHWTFMETVKAETNMVNQLKKWKKKFHCRIRDTGKLKNQNQSSWCRIKLGCTTADYSGCLFALLIQKTDRGRFHFYWSGSNHTCLYAGKRGGGRWQKKLDDEEEIKKMDYEEETETYDEESEEEEKMNDDEEMEEDEKEEEDDEEDEKIDDEGKVERDDGDNVEEEVDEEEELEENEEDDEEEEWREDEYNVEDREDFDEVHSVANALQSRSPTIPHEINDIQFVDFVDHPKCEGIKMRRLGEPKKDPGTDTETITLHARQKWKVSKQEIVKKEVLEEQPGPSNRGENNGTMELPTTTINRQNQKPARERWWTNAANHGLAATNNQQRFLRERKGRINYRE